VVEAFMAAILAEVTSASVALPSGFGIGGMAGPMAFQFDPMAPLPLVTAGLPGIGGRIKEAPEDFEVEEIPAYPASGEGDFLYLWIEKRDMGAEYFARQVGKRLAIATGEVGTAGLKDRRAITRQMVSVPASCAHRLPALEGAGIRVLSASRHANKLRPGHLHGNRFRVLIRGVDADAEKKIIPIIQQLQRDGLPNYYGAQRFGRGGETLAQGMTLVRGERNRPPSRNRFLRKLAISAVQSALFNHYLARRLVERWYDRVVPGDVMVRRATGGMFVAEDVALEQPRYDTRETVPAGPIFGRKMFAARADAAAREAEILESFQLSPQVFGGLGKLAQGTRRQIAVYVPDLAAIPEGEGMRLTFILPAGGYATVLLEEITKNAIMDRDETASY
jgi:tRNA pseudouridine13 synthase